MVMVLGPASVDVVVRTETVTVAAGEGEVWTDVGEKSHDTPIGRPVQLKVTVVGNELVTVKLVAVLGLPCVAVTAPGVNIITAYPGGYAVASGTSFSAAFVSAEAALVASLTPNGVKTAITRSAVNIDNLNLSFTGQLGYTKGKGEGPKQAVFEGDIPNTGASYTFHGVGSPVDVAFPSGNPSSFTGTTLDWIFGASPSKSNDEEKYGRADGELALGNGMFKAPAYVQGANTSPPVDPEDLSAEAQDST